MCFPKKKRRGDSVKGLHEIKIVVVGAGIAGLACATRLVEMGFQNLVVLEANDRIGGRIHTVNFSSSIIELGAKFVHGERENPCFELVQDRDILQSDNDVYEHIQCIRSNGEIIADHLLARLKCILVDIFLDRSEYLPYFQGSLGDYLNEQYALALEHPDYEDIPQDVAYDFLETFKRLESAESGAPVHDISGSGFDQLWDCEGDYLMNFGQLGCTELLRVLMKADLFENTYGVLESKIELNRPVRHIYWHAKNCTAQVKCENSMEHYEADHVIVTIPLGVLKEHHKNLFDPKLPDSKVTAIESLGFGAMVKIFLEFPRVFWPPSFRGFALVWRPDDAKKIRDGHHAWLEHIHGFNISLHNPRILIAHIVGPICEYVETLSDHDVKHGCLFLLRKFLPHFEIPEPIKVKKTDWLHHKYFRGCFTYRSLDTEATKAGALELTQPLSRMTKARIARETPDESDDDDDDEIAQTIKPIVLFAGEATSNHFYSSMHGALVSGWREADRLAGYYGVGY